LNVYISFGTVIWRYFAAEAAAALQAIARACAGIDHVRAIISLAGVEVDQSLAASLQSRNVQVLPRVDQMEVLKQADLFITHHGVNSTHEAIFNRVPMISCPFFWDQPALAAKCQRLGLGIPLTGAPGAPIAIDDVKAAISAFEAARQSFATRLTQARQWEIQTMNQRDAVIQRMLDLIPA
jgi:UDP:flavonoid glycosyltransferase YjiC (YdhE family)